MNIRRASKNDLIAITKIASERVLQNNNEDKNGFLVSNLSKAEYTKILNSGTSFYVAVDAGEVVGFLFGYSESSIDLSNPLYKEIAKVCPGNFVIIKQVCIKKGFEGKGIARSLYQYFKSTYNLSIYLAIVTKPMNEASLRFHEKLGFSAAFNYVPNDGVERVIMNWTPEGQLVDFDKDLLIIQYDTAVELYKHEDNLNWSKLNHFFYVTAGLFGVFSLLLKAEIRDPQKVLLTVLLGAFGVLTSFVFYATVKSGMRYMSNRKHAVIMMEHVLEKHGGMKVVSYNIVNDANLKVSLTSLMMKSIPLIMLILWLVIMIMNIYFFILLMI